MNLQDLDALAKGLAPVVTRLIAAATAPLIAETAKLRGELGELRAGVAMLQARPDVAEVRALVDAAVEAIPRAQDGRDGAPGADADPQVIRSIIAEFVAEAVAAIPLPKDGAAGPAGADGIDGVDGQDAAPLADEQVAAALEAYMLAHPPAAGPPGADGRDGAAGADGADARAVTVEQIAQAAAEWLAANPPAAGAAGEPGAPGADGVGLAGAVIARDGGLVVTLTNGEQKALGLVVGRDGDPGRDGAPGRDGRDGLDGLGFEDMDLAFDGERKLVATFARGEVSKAVEIEFPITLHRGVYREATSYLRGDSVTWAGSSWIAKRDAAAGEKPEASDAWLLSVKRGRDGKDGKDGKDGERGPPGLKGEPGRNGRA